MDLHRCVIVYLASKPSVYIQPSECCVTGLYLIPVFYIAKSKEQKYVINRLYN